MQKKILSVLLAPTAFLVALSALASSQGRAPSANAKAPAPVRLQVVSYNIKALPSIVLSGDYLPARFPLIGRLLAERAAKGGPEIVLLQEAFSGDTRLLLEAAAYPHVEAGPGADSFFGVDSGLYILSRYPILEKASRAFGKGNCLSWDCLSNKGVLFARVAVPGLPRPLEVFNTHLQAGRTDTPTRRRQVKALVEFFRKHHRPGNPVIFGGDFNFRPGIGQQSYLDFSKGTKLAHAGKFCLDRGCARSPDVGWHGIWERAVDHQFYSLNSEVEIVPVSVERSYREALEGIKLSDHPAHEVVYDFRPRPGPVAAPPIASSVLPET